MNFNPNAMSETNENSAQQEVVLNQSAAPLPPLDSNNVVDRLQGSAFDGIDEKVKELAQGIMDAIDKRTLSPQMEEEKLTESGKDAIFIPKNALDAAAQEGREKYDFMYTGASTVGVEVLDPNTVVEEKSPVDPAAYLEKLIKGNKENIKPINYGRQGDQIAS